MGLGKITANLFIVATLFRQYILQLVCLSLQRISLKYTRIPLNPINNPFISCISLTF